MLAVPPRLERTTIEVGGTSEGGKGPKPGTLLALFKRAD
jgi:hypothetical protein